MELFLFIIGLLLATGLFGYLVSQIRDDIVRWTCLTLGGALIFFGGVVGLLNNIA